MPPTTARFPRSSAAALKPNRNFLALAPALLFAVFFLALSALPASVHADNSGLVGYWKFDEGTSTQATDFSGNGNTGTLVNNPTWVSGKHGRALNFAGGANYLSLPANTSIMQNRQQATISAWVNQVTNPANYNAIVEISINNGGTPTQTSRALLEIQDDELPQCGGRAPDSDPKQFVVAVNPISNGVWHHIVCTINYASDTILIYVDGVLQSTTGTPNFTNTSTDDTTSDLFKISGQDDGINDYFNGPIDDVRIYSRVLSATEIAKLYTAGATLHKPPNNLGLVGYWSFDEGTTTRATDFSGNGNTGTLSGSTLPTWVSGKHNKALSFDGSSSYVSVPSSPNFDSTSGTWALWFKTTYSGASNLSLLERASGSGPNGIHFYIGHSYGLAAIIENASVFVLSTSQSSAVNDGNWHHAAITFDGTNVAKLYMDGILFASGNPSASWSFAAQPLLISKTTTGSFTFFPGTIDDVRIYNRALSAGEVANLYQSGAVKVGASSASLQNGSSLASGLVGLWTFDGKDTNWRTAQELDESGQGNTGSLVNMSTSTSPALGHLGQALSFDGSTNYVQPSPVSGLPIYATTGYSVSLWLKGAAGQTDKRIFAEGSSTSNSPVFDLGTDNNGVNGKLDMFLRNSANTALLNHVQSTNTVLDGTWHHVVWVDNNGTALLYLDGLQDATNFDYTPAGSFGFDREAIGALLRAAASNFFSGTIDDVRIYNRALSATEVQQLYKLGTVTIHAN